MWIWCEYEQDYEHVHVQCSLCFFKDLVTPHEMTFIHSQWAKAATAQSNQKWSLNLEGNRFIAQPHALSLRNRIAPGWGSKARTDHLITHEPAVHDPRSRLTVNWFKLWEKLVGSPLKTSSKGLKDSSVYLASPICCLHPIWSHCDCWNETCREGRVFSGNERVLESVESSTLNYGCLLAARVHFCF